jgi:hypothetical protein
MNRKYFLVVLIVIVFLVCVLYPPYKQCPTNGDSDLDPNELDPEAFSVNNIPSKSTINLFAKKCADQLAVGTYETVVKQCRTDDFNRTVGCMVGYKKYYENVIKDPVFDLYDSLKRLEGSPDSYDYKLQISSQEMYDFVLSATTAYARSLSNTLNYFKKNSVNGAFTETVFINTIKQYLVFHLTNIINLAYTTSSS